MYYHVLSMITNAKKKQKKHSKLDGQLESESDYKLRQIDYITLFAGEKYFLHFHKKEKISF